MLLLVCILASKSLYIFIIIFILVAGNDDVFSMQSGYDVCALEILLLIMDLVFVFFVQWDVLHEAFFAFLTLKNNQFLFFW